jgi:hypothetical protein
LDVSMRNVELKARDPDPARTLERALALGAEATPTSPAPTGG